MNRKMTILLFLSAIFLIPGTHLQAKTFFSARLSLGRHHSGFRAGHFRHRPGRWNYPRHRYHHYSGWYAPRYRTVRTYYYTQPLRTVYVYEQRPSVIVREPPRIRVVDPHPVFLQPSGPKRLIDKVLRAEPDKRLEAAEKLAGQKDIQAVAVLIDVLINDADSRIRIAAATSLGKIGNPLAYEALLRSAEAESDQPVRQAAQQAVETLKSKAEAEKLLVSKTFPPMNQGNAKLGEYLQDTRFGTKHIREKAAKELADFKGTQAVAALINLMINDYEDDVREEAAESLGKIGDRMALPFLQWTRAHDPDKSTRNDAEEAIEKIRSRIR